MKRNLLAGWLTMGMLVLALGCGPKTPPTVPASGIVMMDGKPLDGAGISVYSENGTVAMGTTDANGKFSLTTTIGPNQYPGALVGKHKIGVTKSTNTGDPAGEKKTYSDPKEMAVKMGGMATSQIKTTFIVPQQFNSAQTSGLSIDVPAGGSDALKIEFKSK